MTLRWLPISIGTTMSTFIVMAALFGKSGGRGGIWRGQGKPKDKSYTKNNVLVNWHLFILEPNPHTYFCSLMAGLEYTISILKPKRTITITDTHANQMKIEQTTTVEEIFVSSSRPTTSSSMIESNSNLLDRISSASTSKTASDDNNYSASKVTLMGSLNGTGEFTRVRYRFDNVFLETENLLSVHLPASVPLPTEELLVNGVYGAIPSIKSNTNPPTVFYHKDIHQQQEHYLNVSYTHISISKQDEHLRNQDLLRKCIRWETRPVYLMYVPHPSNFWHVFNDALMGVFQTLREEGHLPLAEIDDAGNMIEYLEGLDPECHWKLDLYGNGSAYRPEKCLFKTGRLPNAPSKSSIKGSPKDDEWCRPGLVAFNRSAGPIILMAKGALWPDKKWRHIFTAISEDIRGWDDMVGTCFKELYIVKSHTLDFYTAIYSVYPDYPHAHKQRVGGIQAFQELMATAERHHREARYKKNPKLHVWGGYSSSELETLRQGIGPENIGALSVLRDIRTAGIKKGRLEQKDVVEINRMRREETEDMLAFVKEKQQIQEEQRLPSNAGGGAQKKPRKKADAIAYPQFAPTPSAPRPVVTFMWRKDFSRCAANEADILAYLLLRYNVTVRVTSFDEPLTETMDLMNSTDILLGMHGAGWTNALFLKRGAAAMQMLPYNWQNPATKISIRGGSYRAIIKAKEAKYVEWVNPFANYSFVRPKDFDSMARRGLPLPYKYALHPAPDWEAPYASETKAGNHWIYQNTLVKIRDIAVKLDAMMSLKGIVPMPLREPVVAVETVVEISESAAAAELNF